MIKDLISYINNDLRISSKEDVLYYTDIKGKRELSSRDILAYCSYKAVSRLFPYSMGEFESHYLKPLVDSIDTILLSDDIKLCNVSPLVNIKYIKK
jgi:hypothetical protein